MAATIVGSKQAEQLKQDGNNYFQKNRFGAAIDAYTEAITLSPNVPIYWTNRALCHRRRKYVFISIYFVWFDDIFELRVYRKQPLYLPSDWRRVEEDCRKAIQLDHNSVKGHYYLGLALLQKQQYAEGVRELEKALDLGRGANPGRYIVEEIWEELAKAKYKEWEHESTSRSWELQNLKESCELALKRKHVLDSSQIEGLKDENSTFLAKQLEGVGKVFMKAAEDDTPTEVPDYLCCKITLDIFRDPVITPSGFTYERAVILDHLQKVGQFDPITRAPLFPLQLVPNLAIKEAVRAFLDKHGWAYRIE